MEPFEEMTKEAAQATFTRLTELFDSESEDETESVEITDDFSDFLTIGTKGPKLDERTVRFLCANGVNGVRSFLLYSQQSFQDMLLPLPTVRLPEISHNHGLRDVKIYGDYLFLHDIMDVKATAINFDSLDVENYQLYLCLFPLPQHRGGTPGRSGA
jgi:hypothetical protein